MRDSQSTPDWRPTAELAALEKRARVNRCIREWFHQQNILEVETPQLSSGATTDPNIESFSVDGRYLRTSAEFHLKRLLAAGCPDVYELGKVFRVDESGRYHNPEFTMLEWYRLGIDHQQLIGEVELLLRYLHEDDAVTIKRISYRDFWLQHTEIDLASTSCAQVASCLESKGIEVPASTRDNLDELQDLAMATVLADCMPESRYSCLYDYPASQASLARIDNSNPDWSVANRFEIYYGAIELANGFYELTDGAEQLARFQSDNKTRTVNGQTERPIDHRLTSALDHGLPDCAGVAVGMDRLMMILLDDIQSLDQVVSFNWCNA